LPEMSSRIRTSASVAPIRLSSLAAKANSFTARAILFASKAALSSCIAVKSISGIVSTTAPSLAIPTLTLMAASGCDFSFSPPNDWTHYELAQQLLQAGYYKEAIKELKAFISEDPSNLLSPNAQFEIAYTYDYKLNDYQNAIAEYRKVLQNYPNYFNAPYAQLKIAHIYDEKIHDYPNAVLEYKNLIQNYPNSPFVPFAKDRLKELCDIGYC